MKNFKLICLMLLLWLILISTFISAQEFPIATGNDNTLAITPAAFDGTNYLVPILGNSQNQANITAQLVSSSGTLVGPRISTGHTGGPPQVAFDGVNYLLIWTNVYDGEHITTGSIYGQFINKSGSLVGNAFIIASNVNARWGRGQAIAYNDSSYIVTFLIGGDDKSILYGQRVNRSGSLLGNPIQISSNYAREAHLAYDGTNYLIAWVEDTNNKYVYGQFLSRLGILIGSNFIIDNGEYDSDNPVTVTFDGSRFLVTFHEQAPLSKWNLFARFVAPSGIVDPNRITIREYTKSPGYPFAAFDGTNYLITWVDDAFLSHSIIRGRFFSTSGIPIDNEFIVFNTFGGKAPLVVTSTYGNNKYLIVTTRLDTTSLNNGDVYGKFIATMPGLKIEPYTSDANTVLLDHFDGATSASIFAYSENFAPCGPVKPSPIPSYSYVVGPNGLNQALSLNAPIGQPIGSASYLQFPGGQLLSQPNGTIEFWIFLTTYGIKSVSLVDQGPFIGSCAGWTFYMSVDSTGQLKAGAWDAFNLTSGLMKVPLNRWTHLATTWGSAGARLYINGMLVGADANTKMPAAGYSGSVLISPRSISGAAGSIDELRISNVQRTTFNVNSSEENTQIPNSGFENWAAMGNFENPIGWATMNSVSTGPFYSCTKSTDHYPVSIGNYSIRLENNTSLTQWTGGYGMAVTNAFDYPFKPAFPIVDHPNKLCGYYKYNSMNNDSMFVRIVLFQKGVVVNYFTFITGNSTSTWKSFTLPMTYSSADSATLYFSAFWPNTPTDGPNGNSVLYIDNLSFDNLITSISLSSKELPSNYILTQNYPNPFNPTTKIKFGLPERSIVKLAVYDILGREVSTLVNQELEAGYHEVKFNAGNLSSGVYFYQLRSGLFVETKKLTLIK